MTDDWGAASIRSIQEGPAAWDRPFVPPALRPVRARGLLAVLVIGFTAALVVTLGLPLYAYA